MKDNTLKTLENVLAMDDSIPKEHRERILDAAKNYNQPEPDNGPRLSRLLKATEVAKRLGVCVKTVRNWRDQGLLVPFVPPGKTKAAGYWEKEVERFQLSNGVPA